MKRRATMIRSVYSGIVPDRRERGMDALSIAAGLLLLFMLLWAFGVL